jgi:hypothetical protein
MTSVDLVCRRKKQDKAAVDGVQRGCRSSSLREKRDLLHKGGVGIVKQTTMLCHFFLTPRTGMVASSLYIVRK